MNEPIGYHVICRLTDSRVIAPTREQRRQIARIVLEMSRGHRLLAFNAPDTHLHLEHLENRATSGKLVRRVQISIRRRLGLPVGFAQATHKAIRHQGHLLKTFDYILRQQPHHELLWDPYHDASNLPDLLGMRLIGQHTAAHVRSQLPRVHRAQLLGLLGVDSLPESTGPLVQVVPATLAALGLNRLVPRSATTRAAWRAVMALLQGHLSVAGIANLLGTTRETLSRLQGMEPDPRLVRAIRLQLGIRQVIPAAADGVFVESPVEAMAGRRGRR